MNNKTNTLQQNAPPSRPLDDFDRKILNALTEDARLTYAEIGKMAALSAPAVYERVKRLKASGVLQGTTTSINGIKVGKPFLAFVHVQSSGWGKGEHMMALRDLPEVEELHSVAGDACLILKVRTENAGAMEDFLAYLYSLPSVTGTKSYIALSTYLERPIQPNITQDWPKPIAPKE
ncbi:MAG: Lrp/AsnC family transcriptional regulator [Maricaulaceae bacterium]